MLKNVFMPQDNSGIDAVNILDYWCSFVLASQSSVILSLVYSNGQWEKEAFTRIMGSLDVLGLFVFPNSNHSPVALCIYFVS